MLEEHWHLTEVAVATVQQMLEFSDHNRNFWCHCLSYAFELMGNIFRNFCKQ
jgi:hypothetical protein